MDNNTNEIAMMKRKMEKKAAMVEEEEKVCGPKVMHKVNKFLNEIN